MKRPPAPRHAATRAGLAAALTSLALPAALAAGGHHDVDDATILEAGHCQVETWAFDGRRPTLRTWHVGPACHAAGMEWGLNLDGVRLDGRRLDSLGPQVKWVLDPQAKRFTIGAALGAGWRPQGPGGALLNVLIPATLWLGPDGELQLHANAGRDRDPLSGQTRRWGLAADWAAGGGWTLTAERRFQFGAGLTRAGLRFNLTPLQSLDLSIARGGGSRVLALGYTAEWAR